MKLKQPVLRHGNPANVVKLVWVNLSIFAFIMIFLELSAYLYFAVRIAMPSKPADPTAVWPTAAWVDAIPADAYTDRSWLMAWFHEWLSLERKMQWEPYTYRRLKPFSGSYVNADANGRRHTWNLPTTQAVEIYMFGGSTMFGVGARDDYTIPSILSKMLAQAFPGRIQVTNYGLSGFVSTQEMILLFRELQRGCRPQIVIFYDGYNDTFSAFSSRTAGVPQNEYKRVAEFNLLHPSRARDFFREVLKKVLKRSNLYQFILIVNKNLFEQKQLPPLSSEMEAKLVADVLNYYATNIDLIEAVGEKMRFASVFYWQPTPYTRAIRNRFEESWLTDHAQEKLFSEVYASVRHSPLPTKTSFHDISDVFQGYDGTLYIDYAHTTERGNQIIANRMFHDVARLVEREIINLKTAFDRMILSSCR